MRGFQGFRGLTGDLQGFVDRQRPALHPIPERFAGGQFHHQRALSLGFDQSIDDGDVGVIQRRQDLGFAIEAREAFGIAGQGARTW